jgi:trehalose 6-phosphate phosphatase
MTAELPADLAAAVERVCRTPRLLVAMDFDGTLSPLVDRAGDARPLPASAAAFAALAGCEGTTTALISGRALASLRAVASPDDRALLIGSHGAEVWLGPDATPLELDAGQRTTLERVHLLLAEVSAAHPGTSLEFKPAGVVLHTREAADPVAEAAALDAHARLRDLRGAFVADGKRVVEVSVVRADKGQGLGILRAAAGATAVIFAGDDVTDEHAFAALGPEDLGIKVGPGDTAAAYRIGSPDELPAVLAAVLALRRAP